LPPKKKEKKYRHTNYFKLFMLALSAFILAFALTFIVLFTLNTHNISDMVRTHNFLDAVNSKVYDINGKIITEFYQENRIPISLSEIPQHLINACIAIEDDDFYQHKGISIRGIFRSQWTNFKNIILRLNKEARPQGGSTITQQLGINIFLTREVSINRKIQDMLIALQIERNFTKDEIMTMYLNEIYFGHGAYGVQAAAKMYFNKNAKDLNLPECALLAGIPRGPYYYSPVINMEASLKRRNIILKRMHALGYITETELETSQKTPIQIDYHNKRDIITAPYFSTYILSQLLDEYGANMIYRGGLKIYTTLDLEKQRFAEKALLESGYEGAVIAIEPKSGYIEAMVGGQNFEESKFNRAIQAYRQPGSAFKPFIYLAAIDSGFTPSYIIEDSPITFENGWSPQNYEQEFRGPVTMREAFEHSINVVGVKLLEQVGIKKAINYAHKAGIKSELRPDLSLALGTSEMNPLEIASAYATIANMGERVTPTSIIRIEDYDGHIMMQNNIEKKRVFNAESCYILIDLMKGVIDRGTGWNANIGRPAAGKTGTTDDFIDAWFIGFTPELVTAVYVGNDDRKPLGNKMTGGVVAAPIWANFMKNSLSGIDKTDFNQPDDIVKVLVCKESGLLPTDSCENLVSSAFLKGTEPVTHCNIHGEIIEKPIPKESSEIKRPYFEEIEKIKEKNVEKEEQPQEEETLQSLIEQLKEKYKKDKK